MTCSGTYAALKAGQEGARCSKCDKPTPDGPCDCANPYTIHALGTDKVASPHGEHYDRGEVLAVSLGGRYVPYYKGYALTPSKCALWEGLFAAGVEPIRPCVHHGPCWRYRFPGEKNTLNVYQVASRIRRGAK